MRRNRFNRNVRTMAFTLIELLAVILIIALLSGLIVPILSRGKQMAKDADSMIKLDQLGTAYLIYCADYDDTTPNVGNQSIIYRLRTGQASYSDFPDYFGQIGIREALDPYVRSADVWRSLVDPGEAEIVPYISNYERMGTSYDTIGASFCFGKLTQFSNPSESGLLREASPYRRNRVFTWRSDGSTKLLEWVDSGDQMTNSVRDLGCPE